MTVGAGAVGSRRGALALLLLVLLSAGRCAAAPGGLCPIDGWSPPEDVFVGTGRVAHPLLVADSAGALHLFFTETTPGRNKPVQSLWYARLADGHWSTPRAIITQPEGEPLHAPRVVLDGAGILHLVFQGPKWGALAYHNVPIAQILDPGAWGPREVVSQGSVLNADVAVGPDDAPYVLYSSTNHQLYSVNSQDGGRTWSSPVQVSRLDPTREATTGARLAVDARGRLHAVWGQSQLPHGWPPAGVYYARSTTGGRTWTAPVRLAGELYAQPNVAVRGEKVHLAWGAVATVGHRVHQWSEDGGGTWSTPQLVSGSARGGITGAPMLEFDSAGRLHLVTSIDGPRSIERVVHMTWDGERWSDPELVSGGTAATDSVEWPALAIALGQQLHVVYEGDYQRIWHSSERAAAPEVAARPVPTPATDLWSRAQRWSPPFRVMVAVLTLLALDAAVRGVRWARRGAAA